MLSALGCMSGGPAASQFVDVSVASQTVPFRSETKFLSSHSPLVSRHSSKYYVEAGVGNDA